MAAACHRCPLASPRTCDGSVACARLTPLVFGDVAEVPFADSRFAMRSARQATHPRRRAPSAAGRGRMGGDVDKVARHEGHHRVVDACLRQGGRRRHRGVGAQGCGGRLRVQRPPPRRDRWGPKAGQQFAPPPSTALRSCRRDFGLWGRSTVLEGPACPSRAPPGPRRSVRRAGGGAGEGENRGAHLSKEGHRMRGRSAGARLWLFFSHGAHGRRPSDTGTTTPLRQTNNTSQTLHNIAADRAEAAQR